MLDRQNALTSWLRQTVDFSEFSLAPLAGDASFRRYYRLTHANGSYIVMDAPPQKESIQAFITISRLWQAHGLRTPHIDAFDSEQGFALLEDFGDALFFNQLTSAKACEWYHLALETLIALQKYPLQTNTVFPAFNAEFILKELGIFEEWFLNGYLKITLLPAEEALLQQTWNWLAAELCSQPQVLIHRDYHSRNIMVPHGEDTRLALIDFQDAMRGPLTYDVASLLKDCYIQWPQESVMQWLRFFYDNSPVAADYSWPLFVRAFEVCGIQRHLKVLGVFARLYLRDNKPGYLKDLPLTLHYLMEALETYPELQAFYQFMQEKGQLP